MTPKEKAKDLVDKFSNEVLIDNYEAKRCALIAVVEVIESIPSELLDIDNEGYSYFYINEDVEYWNKVKQEIELL